MKVLIACEYSQTVALAFHQMGHEVMSCDLLPGELGLPHYQGDCIDLLSGNWDLIIAHPPCTYLSAACAYRWPDTQDEIKAAQIFIQKIYDAPAKMICIENPSGWLNNNWRKPDQIIHPYYFGAPWKKRTCLWLKNLPPLIYTCMHSSPKHFVQQFGGNHDTRKMRSRFFPEVAQAMANQWSNLNY